MIVEILNASQNYHKSELMTEWFDIDFGIIYNIQIDYTNRITFYDAEYYYKLQVL